MSTARRATARGSSSMSRVKSARYPAYAGSGDDFAIFWRFISSPSDWAAGFLLDPRFRGGDAAPSFPRKACPEPVEGRESTLKLRKIERSDCSTGACQLTGRRD